MSKRREVASPAAGAEEHPVYRTRVLWYVLSGLYAIGAACAIVGIYALSLAWGGGPSLWLWLPVGIVAILGGLFCLWLTLGIMYRVDRLRGNLTRRVEMFE